MNHLQVSTKVAGTVFAPLPWFRCLERTEAAQPTGGSDLLHDTSLNGRCSIFPAAAKNAWNESATGKAHTQCRTNSTLRSAGYACMANLARKTRLFVQAHLFCPVHLSPYAFHVTNITLFFICGYVQNMSKCVHYFRFFL